MLPKENAVYEWKGCPGMAEGLYRLLWMDKARDEAVLFALNDKASLPFQVSLSGFEDMLVEGAAVLSDFPTPAWMLLEEESISDDDKKVRAERWQRLAPLVTGSNRGAIFDSEMRGYLCRKHAKELGIARENLYPLLKRYWRYGQVQNALLPSWLNCGHRGQILAAGEKKRGRPPKTYLLGHDLNSKGVNVTKDDLTIIAKCLLSYHLRQKRSLSDTYDLMVDKYYARREIRNGEIYQIPISLNKRFKLRAFRYWAHRLMADQRLLHRALDMVTWGKRHRGLPGKARDTTIGPADIFEIDATIDNAHLVASYHRNHLIGRMIAYEVVDRATGMITGIHTALEGPSWNTARMALYNAFTDKVAFCQRYGLEIQPEEWPCQEICNLLVADQGEVLSNAAQHSLQNMLGIDSEYNAPAQAERKGTVEGTHIQISEPLSWTPGAWRVRGCEYDRREGHTRLEEACLTLAERTQLYILEVLEHNNNVRVPHLLTKEMIRDGVKPFRRDIYLWGLKNQTGNPIRAADKANLYRCLLPKKSGSIAASGLLYRGMTYLPIDEDYDFLLARARNGRIGVDIHIDSNSSNFVYQFDEESNTWTTWKQTAASMAKFGNERLEEIEEHLATAQLECHDDADNSAAKSAVSRQRQQAIVHKAKAAKDVAPAPRTKTEYLADRKSKRDLSKALSQAELGDEMASVISNIQAKGEWQVNTTHSAISSYARINARKAARFGKVTLDPTKEKQP